MKSTIKFIILAIISGLCFNACAQGAKAPVLEATFPAPGDKPLQQESVTKYKKDLEAYLKETLQKDALSKTLSDVSAQEAFLKAGVRPDMEPKLKENMVAYIQNAYNLFSTDLSHILRYDNILKENYFNKIDKVARDSKTEKDFYNNMLKSGLEQSFITEVKNTIALGAAFQKETINISNMCTSIRDEYRAKNKTVPQSDDFFYTELDYRCRKWQDDTFQQVFELNKALTKELYADNPAKYDELNAFFNALATGKTKKDAKIVLTYAFIKPIYNDLRKTPSALASNPFTDEVAAYSDKIIAKNMKRPLNRYDAYSTAKEIVEGIFKNGIKTEYSYEERLHKLLGYSKEDAAKKAKREEALRKKQMERRKSAWEKEKDQSDANRVKFNEKWWKVEDKERKDMEKKDPILPTSQKK